MKFAVIGVHRDCLRKQGWIEFDELLTSAQLSIINTQTAAVLANRVNQPVGRIYEIEAEEIFSVGRDLWRDSQPLKKIVLSRTLAEVASELIEHKPLRFGYDLLLPSPAKSILYNHGSLSALLSKAPTLDEISCIQGVRCGLILCIKAGQQPVKNESQNESQNESESEIKPFFPSQVGNGVFFRPDIPIPFTELADHPGSLYLLLVYTENKAVYRMQTNDPHVNDFKQLGYNFGDKLSDSLNPLVFN